MQNITLNSVLVTQEVMKSIWHYFMFIYIIKNTEELEMRQDLGDKTEHAA